jgi:hypothetical protein
VEITTRTRFLEDYARIRHAEGRGSEDPAYYRALPYADLTGRNSWQWAIRARTYRHFENHVLAPFEKKTGRPLNILDLGAGNGWTSHRLTLRKHQVIALDILTDEKDGLKATKHYPVKLPWHATRGPPVSAARWTRRDHGLPGLQAVRAWRPHAAGEARTI